MGEVDKEREPKAEGPEATEDYEPPEVEEVSTDAGPAVTAAGLTYGAITLIEDDDE